MTMPGKAVDRIFSRLSATYGAAWDRAMGSAPLDDVKAAWAHELSGFAARLQDVAWALEHLPERCPNVIEFRNLCRQAPAPELPRLESPKADPARVAEAMQKLAPLRVQQGAACTANKDWAHRILARAEAGERITPYSLMSARMALGLPVKAPGQRAGQGA